MKLSRMLALLVACAAVLLLAASAQARSSGRRSTGNRNNQDRGGRYRLIEDDKDNKREREQERLKKQEEEKKKKAEEKREKADERKKAQEEKKKAAQAKRQEAAEKAKPKRETAGKAKDKGGKAVAKKDDTSDQEAAQLHEQAEAQFEKGELLPGVALLRQCIAEHEGSDAAKDAEARLDQLLAHEKFGPMILHGEAEALFAAQRYRKALNKFGELVTAFPGSEQAAAAAKRLAEIREGDLLSKTVYTDEELKDARFWLLVGNIHRENERVGEAQAAWRKVAEDFPGSPFAKHAEGKLTVTRGS